MAVRARCEAVILLDTLIGRPGSDHRLDHVRHHDNAVSTGGDLHPSVQRSARQELEIDARDLVERRLHLLGALDAGANGIYPVGGNVEQPSPPSFPPCGDIDVGSM
jgi:hypothetical protein